MTTELALVGLVLFNAVIVGVVANPPTARYGKPLPTMLAFVAVVVAAWLARA